MATYILQRFRFLVSYFSFCFGRHKTAVYDKYCYSMVLQIISDSQRTNGRRIEKSSTNRDFEQAVVIRSGKGSKKALTQRPEALF